MYLMLMYLRSAMGVPDRHSVYYPQAAGLDLTLTYHSDYMLNKKDYVMHQVGNPEGADKPNKKYYDPRYDRSNFKML
jgi:hypothetical protein